MPEHFDVAVVGAGVVGCAIAMELSRYQLSTALIEAGADIGAGTSKANSAILHTGFDAPPGSLEAALVRRGYARFHEMSDALGLPIGHTGAIVAAWTADQATTLSAIAAKAARNGVEDTVMLRPDELYALEPRLGAGIKAGLNVPGESITCPFTPVIAFGTTAVRNGVQLHRNFTLEAAERVDVGYALHSASRTVHARAVVNAAGLHSDEVDRLFGKDVFSVRPRKGEFLVFDKPSRGLLSHILLPVPTERTKGVLIAPTVFGNLLLGPTAVDVSDKTDTSVSHSAIESLLEAGARMLPELTRETVTCSYAGLRAATEHQDYQLHVYAEDRYVAAGGIRSTGLSASLGIAEFVRNAITGKLGFPTVPRTGWEPCRAPSITDLSPRTATNDDMIARDEAYGSVICHCEGVSFGEIRDALQSSIPAVDLGGVKRRTRALMGRCQGFNCYARICEMVETYVAG